jgi:hypothetical protein
MKVFKKIYRIFPIKDDIDSYIDQNLDFLLI